MLLDWIMKEDDSKLKERTRLRSEAPAPSVQPIKVFSVYHLHAPPPGRNVPLQWLAPRFGMASLCRSTHSLEPFLRHSFLNLRRFYLVVLGLGAPLSSPT